MKRAYACYRLPGADCYTRVVGSSAEIDSYSHVGNQSGFVVAPFVHTPSTPIIVIQPEEVTRHDVKPEEVTRHEVAEKEDTYSNCAQSDNTSSAVIHSAIDAANNDRQRYGNDFQIFHDKLTDGTFSKIVLSRTAEEDLGALDVMTLFLRACRLYPNLFVALVSAPQCGTWLTATPEILIERGSCQFIERDSCQYHTMALAGTMTKGDHWNTKNMEEHGYVVQYISDSISRLTDVMTIEGPRTVSAGDIVHLRTDFTFSLNENKTIGDVVSTLHPTPAVCGMPKQETMDFIVANESHRRLYYSGFMGPVDISGETHLYVSLRCMNVNGNHCRLYAGGGLLSESVEQEEWNETEAKMLTMRRCLRG